MNRRLVAAILLMLPAVTALAEAKPVSLAPVPYELRLPEEIARHLSTGPLDGPFAEEAGKAGAAASTVVLYEPDSGEKTILMSVYYFPEARFDAAQRPDEPPRYGREVIRKDGMVLSVAGPFDTIFDPGTPDGQKVIAADALIYSPATYGRTE